MGAGPACSPPSNKQDSVGGADANARGTSPDRSWCRTTTVQHTTARRHRLANLPRRTHGGTPDETGRKETRENEERVKENPAGKGRTGEIGHPTAFARDCAALRCAPREAMLTEQNLAET